MIRCDRRFLLTCLLGASLCAVLAGPSLAADSCSQEVIEAALVGRKASPADLSLIERTCQASQRQDRAASQSTLAVAQGGGGGGSTEIAASGGSPEIHCGHDTCTCWNGNVVNGCRLASNVCADPVTCVGALCICTARD